MDPPMCRVENTSSSVRGDPAHADYLCSLASGSNCLVRETSRAAGCRPSAWIPRGMLSGITILLSVFQGEQRGRQHRQETRPSPISRLSHHGPTERSSLQGCISWAILSRVLHRHQQAAVHLPRMVQLESSTLALWVCAAVSPCFLDFIQTFRAYAMLYGSKSLSWLNK